MSAIRCGSAIAPLAEARLCRGAYEWQIKTILETLLANKTHEGMVSHGLLDLKGKVLFASIIEVYRINLEGGMQMQRWGYAVHDDGGRKTVAHANVSPFLPKENFRVQTKQNI